MHSIDVTIQLGPSSKYQNPSGGAASAGELTLHADANELGNRIYSPATLRLNTVEGETIRDKDGVIFQIIMTDLMVNRVLLTDKPGYELDFYKRKDMAKEKNAQGFFPLNPGAKPYGFWRFEDPDPARSNGEWLRVTQNRENTSLVIDFRWNPRYAYGTMTMTGWRMTQSQDGRILNDGGVYRYRDSPNINATETKLRVTNNLNGTFTQTVTKTELRRTGPVVISETTATAASEHIPIPEDNVAASDVHKSTQTHNADNQLVMNKEWNGHWTYYAAYNERGNDSRRVEQFLNNPYTGTWPDNSNHMYELVHIDNSLEIYVETLLGKVISRHWHKLEIYGNPTPGENNFRTIIDAFATHPETQTWDDPTNLQTIEYLYDGTDNATGKSKNSKFLTIESDGHATMYQYFNDEVSGNHTEVTYQGHMATGPSTEAPYSVVFDQGVKTVLVTDKYRNELSRTEFDLASNLTISSSLVTAKDEFDRATAILHFADTPGSYMETKNDDTFSTDRSGVATLRTLDGLGRLDQRVDYASPTSGSPPEIVTSYKYDGQGRESDVLVGPINNPVAQSHATYDGTGEIASTTDDQGRVTSYKTILTPDGFVQRTTTHPDLSTSIDLTYQDGSLYRISGAADHGRQFSYGVAEDDSGARYTTTTPLDENGRPVAADAETEWTDFAGRRWKTVSPSPSGEGAVTTQYYYDDPAPGHRGTGQLIKVTRTGEPNHLYEYDLLGRIMIEGTRLDTGNSPTTLNGADHVIENLSSYHMYNPLAGSPTVVREDTRRQRLTSTKAVTDTTYTAVDGSGQWVTRDGDFVSSRVAKYDSTTKTVTETTTIADGSKSITVIQNGRMTSVARMSASGVELQKITFTYDAYGKQSSSTSASR